MEHMSTINISYDESYGSIFDHDRNEHQMHATYGGDSGMTMSAVKMYPSKSFHILGNNNLDTKEPTNIVEHPNWVKVDIK